MLEERFNGIRELIEGYFYNANFRDRFGFIILEFLGLDVGLVLGK